MADRISTAQKRAALAEGPDSWRNWRAFELNCRRDEHGFEVALYSDAHFVGHLVDLGPYAVLNTIAAAGNPRAGTAHLALVLRVDRYGRGFIERPMTEEPAIGSHHGGWLADEMAALLSLALEVRCRAGAVTRRFGQDDRRGYPVQIEAFEPMLPAPGRLTYSLVPQIARGVSLSEGEELLRLFPMLDSNAGKALVRAARLYQQALWDADGNPYGSWLQLVSAVEVAAAFHVQREQSGWESIQANWPELAGALRPIPDAQRRAVVELLAPQVRAARRYRQFVKEFHPPPRKPRGPVYARVDWRRIANAHHRIYSYRSRALHEGIPFPAPMCRPPYVDDSGAVAERPFGLGVGVGDSYWPAHELPMLFHVYAYIVGEALRSWWRALPRCRETVRPSP